MYVQNSLHFTPIQYTPIKYNRQRISPSLACCAGAAAFRVRATVVRQVYSNGVLNDDE